MVPGIRLTSEAFDAFCMDCDLRRWGPKSSETVAGHACRANVGDVTPGSCDSPSCGGDTGFCASVFLLFVTPPRAFVFPDLPTDEMLSTGVLFPGRFPPAAIDGLLPASCELFDFFFSGRNSNLLAKASASLTAGSFMALSIVLSSCTSIPSYCSRHSIPCTADTCARLGKGHVDTSCWGRAKMVYLAVKVIDPERWVGVDLKQPTFVVFVQQNVEPKELEAARCLVLP